LEANRHNHITATYHLIHRRNRRAQALRETISPILNQSSTTSTNLAEIKNSIRGSQQYAKKQQVTNLNQTMPIVANPKINNMIEGPGVSNNNNMEGSIAKHHPRDMSVEEGPHSRLSDLNRVVQGLQNQNTVQAQQSVVTTSTNEKQEIIASRINQNTSKSPDKYMINNSLVVTLNDSQVTNGSYTNQGSSQKRSFNTNFRAGSKNQGSIFPSTTTATTANSYTEQRKSDAQNIRKGTAGGYDQLAHPSTSGHQRFKSVNGPPTG
jgi:hypothetical protein